MNYKHLIAMLVLAAFIAPEAVKAQAELDEIIVTAQRRQQAISDVPIAITAFDADTLNKAGIGEAADYLALTPNVSFGEAGEAGSRSIQISIRGIGNVSLGEVVSANSIGYYLDELNVGTVASGSINPQLYDMERIEVLRGPQGTYFGRNANAGALNLSTKLPSDMHEASLQVKAADYGTYGINGMVNIPVSDQVAMRFVASYEESEGLIDNINENGTEDSGYEYRHFRWAVRGELERSTFDLSLNFTDEDQGFDELVPTGILDLDTKGIWGAAFIPVDRGIGFYPANDDKVDHDMVEYNNNEVFLVNLRYQYEMPNYLIRSITGYVDSEAERAFDQDNFHADAVRRNNEYEGESISQEVRFQSTANETVDWIVGAIWAQDEITQYNAITTGGTGVFDHPNIPGVDSTRILSPAASVGFRINENNRVFETETMALFADFTWHLSDRTDITVGGRYSRDDVSNRFFDVVAGENSRPDLSGSEDFDNFSPRFVFNYAVNDEMNFYASASAGYKSGGISRVSYRGDPERNPTTMAIIRPGVAVDYLQKFDEETLWNYEAGIKGSTNRLRYSAAVFYIDWEDMQVQANYLAVPGDISSALEITQNADEAESMGIEGEITAILSENWAVTVGAGLLETEFGDFKNARLSDGSVVDISGKDLPGAPEYTYNLAVDYTQDISQFVGNDAEGFVRLEVSGRSESRSSLEALAAPDLGLPDFPYENPSYTVINLRGGFTSGAWGINAYVKNLFEEEYHTSSNDNFGGSGIRVRPHPRIVGIRINRKFGG
ncbi:MAG: TonB-dependent receptor [Alphaproteobacteria bacterium]|nr:TonB-dependent receptor [Alphaproteobacteria bacterium]